MTLNMEKPAGANGGPSGNVSWRGHPEASLKRARAQHRLTFRTAPDAAPVTVTGREALTLALLLNVGPRGCTSGEASPLGWARRTSHYVHKLRAAGVPVGMTWERIGDARVGRYALTGPVTVVTAGEGSR